MDITGLFIVALVAVTAIAYYKSESFRQFVNWMDELEEKNQRMIKEEKE